jgi:hypothetical protein
LPFWERGGPTIRFFLRANPAAIISLDQFGDRGAIDQFHPKVLDVPHVNNTGDELSGLSVHSNRHDGITGARKASSDIDLRASSELPSSDFDLGTFGPEWMLLFHIGNDTPNSFAVFG